MAVTAAATPVTCPVTGRSWPAIARFTLRTCIRCTGLIDTRHESWWDDDGRARHIICPDACVLVPDEPVVDEPQPTVKVVAVDPRPGDDVHTARLEELRGDVEPEGLDLASEALRGE